LLGTRRWRAQIAVRANRDGKIRLDRRRHEANKSQARADSTYHFLSSAFRANSIACGRRGGEMISNANQSQVDFRNHHSLSFALLAQRWAPARRSRRGRSIWKIAAYAVTAFSAAANSSGDTRLAALSAQERGFSPRNA